MTSEIAEVEPESTALVLHEPEEIRSTLALWLSSLKPKSRRVYEMAIRICGERVGMDIETFAARFLSDVKWAHKVAAAYRAWMLAPIHKDPPRPLSPSTVRVRLSALKSLVNFAGQGDDGLRLIDWTLTTRRPSPANLRDMSGPPEDAIPRLFQYGGRLTRQRDQAILRLLYSSGLRRGEVAALTLADVDARGGVHVLGKGRRVKEFVPIPEGSQRALAAWIMVRGDWPGPLFHHAATNYPKEMGLSEKAIELICARAGKWAGLSTKVLPHGLRHSGVTALLDKNISIREVQRWSRHARADTVMIYDDRRRSREGAEKLASMLEPDESPQPEEVKEGHDDDRTLQNEDD